MDSKSLARLWPLILMASASPGAITSAMLGAFRERKETRDELLSEDGRERWAAQRHRRLATIAKNAG